MRQLFNCKACKVTVAKEYQVLRSEMYGPGRMYERRVMGRINEWGREVLAKNDGIGCPSCSKPMAGSMVHGTKTDHICNEICLEAKGPKCDCSCGGANHGKSYLG